MKRIFAITLFVIAYVTLSQAKQRTPEQIKAAAASVLNSPALKSQGVNKQAEKRTPEILKENSQLTIIGYHDGKGYAIIANDDTFKPVMGFSDTTLPDTLPPGLEWWLETMEKSMKAILAGNKQMPEVKMNAGYKNSVDALITTKWDQSTPYNNMCPTYTENGVLKNYVTGCVATSMAQVMNYHKWPETGVGSRSWYFYPEDGGSRVRVSANFGKTTYDWANMRETYSRNNYTDEEAEAVATLMYHCGVAVKMGYAKAGSGAFSYNACLALREYFRYNENIKVYYRNYFHVDEWMNIIYRELNDGCPVIYGGVSRSGGHSFVFDGYNSSGLVHVNWGWSGSGDGFYDIATLNGYTDGQDMLIVRPETDNRYTEGYRSLWIISQSLNIRSGLGGDIMVTTQGFFNFDVDNFNGMRGILAMNMNTGEVSILYSENTEYIHTEENGGRIFYARDWTNVTAKTSELADGTYRIYLATKDERDTDWQPVRSNETVNNSYIYIKNGTTVSLKAENNSGWTTDISGIQTEGVKDEHVYVYNTTGKLIHTTTADRLRIDDIPASGVLIMKTGNNIRKIVK